MTPFHLNDKLILVTGASSGIGRQIAAGISEMGGSVFITGRNKDKLNETCSLLKGGGHELMSADLTSEEERNKLIDTLPPIDGIVNCAGTGVLFPVSFLVKKKVDENFKINYEAPVLITAAIVKKKKLKKGASIVFISSVSAHRPFKGGAMYSASKAAIEAFSRTAALELYPFGIRSNCIAPAMVESPLYDETEKGLTKETLDKHVKQYPLGVGKPEDVANAAIYLLSDASRWVTGISIILDGGFLLGY